MTTHAARNDLAFRIAIASGKGGTGKTFVATNLFYSLLKQNIPVTLADCDAEGPNDAIFFPGRPVRSLPVTRRTPVIDERICTFCGKCRQFCSFHAIFMLPVSRVIRCMDELCHGCGACLYACDAGAISEKEVQMGELNVFSVTRTARIVESRMQPGFPSPVTLIKAAIREAGHANTPLPGHSVLPGHTVLLDAPPGIGCPFVQTVSLADYVILVTEPTPFGLSDLKQSVECLQTMEKPFGVVLNRAGTGNDGVNEYLDKEGFPLLMEIPFEREIAFNYARGRLVCKSWPGFQHALVKMHELIRRTYGNGHHQR